MKFKNPLKKKSNRSESKTIVDQFDSAADQETNQAETNTKSMEKKITQDIHNIPSSSESSAISPKTVDSHSLSRSSIESETSQSSIVSSVSSISQKQKLRRINRKKDHEAHVDAKSRTQYPYLPNQEAETSDDSSDTSSVRMKSKRYIKKHIKVDTSNESSVSSSASASPIVSERKMHRATPETGKAVSKILPSTSSDSSSSSSAEEPNIGEKTIQTKNIVAVSKNAGSATSQTSAASSVSSSNAKPITNSVSETSPSSSSGMSSNAAVSDKIALRKVQKPTESRNLVETKIKQTKVLAETSSSISLESTSSSAVISPSPPSTEMSKTKNQDPVMKIKLLAAEEAAITHSAEDDGEGEWSVVSHKRRSSRRSSTTTASSPSSSIASPRHKNQIPVNGKYATVSASISPSPRYVKSREKSDERGRRTEERRHSRKTTNESEKNADGTKLQPKMNEESRDNAVANGDKRAVVEADKKKTKAFDVTSDVSSSSDVPSKSHVKHVSQKEDKDKLPIPSTARNSKEKSKGKITQKIEESDVDSPPESNASADIQTTPQARRTLPRKEILAVPTNMAKSPVESISSIMSNSSISSNSSSSSLEIDALKQKILARKNAQKVKNDKLNVKNWVNSGVIPENDEDEPLYGVVANQPQVAAQPPGNYSPQASQEQQQQHAYMQMHMQMMPPPMHPMQMHPGMGQMLPPHMMQMGVAPMQHMIPPQHQMYPMMYPQMGPQMYGHFSPPSGSMGSAGDELTPYDSVSNSGMRQPGAPIPQAQNIPQADAAYPYQYSRSMMIQNGGVGMMHGQVPMPQIQIPMQQMSIQQQQLQMHQQQQYERQQQNQSSTRKPQAPAWVNEHKPKIGGQGTLMEHVKRGRQLPKATHNLIAEINYDPKRHGVPTLKKPQQEQPYHNMQMGGADPYTQQMMMGQGYPGMPMHPQMQMDPQQMYAQHQMYQMQQQQQQQHEMYQQGPPGPS